MDHLAIALGVHPISIPSLRREVSWRDLVALLKLIRILRQARPGLVHTHAAKAGTLVRLAAVLAYPWRPTRPIMVHTYHGHSLSGYFSPRKQSLFRSIERQLARRTDRLIAVSEQVRDELVELGVAHGDHFEVIALGLDLTRFTRDLAHRVEAREALRGEFGIASDALVVTLIARVVPVKRVDRFLRAAVMLEDVTHAHFLVVGDGELYDQLLASPDATALRDRITWTGFRRDIPEICFASDLVVLCSDNEGTPVSLIEASAAGLPTISTRVGGAAKVVVDGETGRIVEADEGPSLASAIRELLLDEELRGRMGAAAGAHARRTFSLDRLVDDLDELYRRLLGVR